MANYQPRACPYSCTACGMWTPAWGKWIVSSPNPSTRICYSCFHLQTLRSQGVSLGRMYPAPTHPNPRFHVRRTLAWHEEDCHLALGPERPPSPKLAQKDEDNAPKPADQRKAKATDQRPCFVDDCNFVAPRRVDMPEHHLRTAHSILPLRTGGRRETALEQWTAVHPVKCPLAACDLAWRGLPLRRSMTRHVPLSHWLRPENNNRLPSGRYTCHVCAAFSLEFSRHFRLAGHLEQSHLFSLTPPFHPMEDDEEEEGEGEEMEKMEKMEKMEVSTSPADDHADPVYSPSWDFDVDMDVEDEGETHRANAPLDDGRSTYEANNAADWMDIDTESPDWAV